MWRKISLGAMGLIYLLAGILHFIKPEIYLDIMPPYIPYHLFMVYASGVVEIILGVALFPIQTRRYAAWAIIAMLIAFLPVHVHMLLNPDEYGPYWLMVLRFPIQALLIYWAWTFTQPVVAANPEAQN